MTNATYAAKETADRKPTAIEDLLARFETNLEKLSRVAEGMENFGHRLSNTNYPQPETSQAKMAAVHQNEGLLLELELKINRLDSIISHLQATGQKISELI
ncbi:MAG TPA: hypothetical protein PKV73_16645 [Agriterribacter sp.]|nr:hypothetical protein [Agriterribacter sp.]